VFSEKMALPLASLSQSGRTQSQFIKVVEHPAIDFGAPLCRALLRGSAAATERRCSYEENYYQTKRFNGQAERSWTNCSSDKQRPPWGKV